MQRDFGDEVLIAVVAVGVIAFAVVFGIVLSLVSQPGADAVTLTPATVVALDTDINATEAVPTAMTAVVASATLSDVATSEMTNVPTAGEPVTATAQMPAETEIIAPSVTATDTSTTAPTSTDTAEPTEQSASVATGTPEPTATETPEPTATNTDIPTATATDTPEPTATETPEPTATNTDIPTATATDTPEPTATSTLTETPTSTATDTPTSTSTDTETPTPTSTNSPTQTATPTLTFTPTFTPVPTGTRDDEGGCIYPPAYARYIVGAGEAFETLAELAGLEADELRGANCLPLDAVLIPGDVVYLPSDAEPTPTPDATETLWSPVGCINPARASITSPAAGAVLDGLTSVIGTAFDTSFAGYRLELRADDAIEFELLRELEVPVLGAVLGTFDLTDREPGLYWLRLVVDTGGEQVAPDAVCVIPVFAP